MAVRTSYSHHDTQHIIRRYCLLTPQIAIALKDDGTAIVQNTQDAMQYVGGFACREDHFGEQDIPTPCRAIETPQNDTIAATFDEGAHRHTGGREEHFFVLFD